jgi:hypothetical protein
MAGLPGRAFLLGHEVGITHARIGHRATVPEYQSEAVSPLREKLSGWRSAIGRESEAYAGSGEVERPLGGYLWLLAAYGAVVAAGTGLVRWRGAELPARFAGADMVMMSIAAHKISRIVTKDPVTSPLRAPVTRFEGPSGEGEITDSVRGAGLRHALGELVTCPFCIAQWIVTILAFGMVLSPRVTRFVTSLFVMLTGSDLLQIAYAKAQDSLH